jgi:hypothetical protein
MTREQARHIIWNEEAFTWRQLQEARRANPEAAAEMDAEVERLTRMHGVAGRSTKPNA